MMKKPMLLLGKKELKGMQTFVLKLIEATQKLKDPDVEYEFGNHRSR